MLSEFSKVWPMISPSLPLPPVAPVICASSVTVHVKVLVLTALEVSVMDVFVLLQMFAGLVVVTLGVGFTICVISVVAPVHKPPTVVGVM